jgi:hypothetical protein
MKTELEQQNRNEISQIAFITNQKNLVSACDALELADIGKDKSPAGIHTKYSRIKITVTDFSNKPSTILSFYLKPAEVRRLYWQARVVKGTKDFSVSWQKKKDRKGKVIAESMTISHEPWRNKEKQERFHYPWRINISSGEYPKGLSKPVYDKRVFKLLSDDEFEDFLSTVVAYLNAWETVVGAPLLKEIHHRMINRFREKEVMIEDEITESGKSLGGYGGYSADELI